MKSKNAHNTNVAVRALEKIWGNQIRADYRRGILPNEKTLQAAIYHYLRRSRPKVDVFVEITKFLGQKGNIPDLIITRNHRIEAVVELKFVPNKGIVYQRDCRKLAKWSRLVGGPSMSKKVDTLELNPKTMNWKDKKIEKNRYTLGSFTAWVFAAIGTDCDAFDPEKVKEYFLSKKCVVKSPSNFSIFRGIVFSRKRRAPQFDHLPLSGRAE
ncbi:MAG: hypothetical protein NTV86_00590 [Planctomycetota bacterium]|nr:hypothetical protein [Planctomycetota bacterium]